MKIEPAIVEFTITRFYSIIFFNYNIIFVQPIVVLSRYLYGFVEFAIYLPF